MLFSAATGESSPWNSPGSTLQDSSRVRLECRNGTWLLSPSRPGAVKCPSTTPWLIEVQAIQKYNCETGQGRAHVNSFLFKKKKKKSPSPLNWSAEQLTPRDKFLEILGADQVKRLVTYIPRDRTHSRDTSKEKSHCFRCRPQPAGRTVPPRRRNSKR